MPLPVSLRACWTECVVTWSIGTLSTTLQMRCAEKSIDPRQQTISIISVRGIESISLSKIKQISDNIFMFKISTKNE